MGKEVCDVCGKPATIIAQDVVAIQRPGASYLHVRPAPNSAAKAGCDDHPVKSCEVATVVVGADGVETWTWNT